MKILLVEDNVSLVEQLTEALMLQRYDVDVAQDGQMGLEMAQTNTYDLLVLDVSLPKLDGISLCQRLRSQGQVTPILMMTARGTSQDKVLGLDAGADDYVVKPISLEELNARIRALQRRNFSLKTQTLQWGKLLLNVESHEVFYQKQALRLTPIEYKLLEAFLRQPRYVHSRSSLLEKGWSIECDLPEEDTVKAHIKALRHKLKAAGAPNLIETVYGVGYRLNPLYQDG